MDSELADLPGIQQGVVVVVHRAGRFLMIKRAPEIIAGGAWCFVGGGIEPGESQAGAVVREFSEEVGGVVTPVRKVWEYTRPDGKLLLYWWLAELQEGVLQSNRQEVAEFRWCTPAEIEALPNVLDSNIAFISEVGVGLLTQ